MTDTPDHGTTTGTTTGTAMAGQPPATAGQPFRTLYPYEPRPPVFPAPAAPASARVLLLSGVTGLAASLLLPSRPGLNVLLTGVALIAAVAPVAHRNRTSVVFALSAAALLVIPVFRDAGWLTALTVLLAVPLGSYALTGGRGWTDLLGGGLALPPVVPHTLRWAGAGLSAVLRSGRGPAGPLVRSVLLAATLLAVFGVLFAQADAAFGRALGAFVPEFSFGSLSLHLLILAFGTVVALSGSYLAVTPPRFAGLVPAAPRPAGRAAWAIPIVALDLLFAGFAAVQADVFLAADKTRLLDGMGITYAEYARQGFWQLLIVTVLVLAVVAVAVRYAPLGAPRDRALVRTLLGSLCGLTLVVVAVALRRLYLYEEAYGWTRLRIWVHAFELWLGVVIVLVAIAGVRLRAPWLPRTVAISGAAGLFALGALNPDGLIAARGVDHYRQAGEADLRYLGSLSADAVPALDRLPEPQRSCALRRIADGLRGDDSWTSLNLGRRRARSLLAEHPAILPVSGCPAGAARP